MRAAWSSSDPPVRGELPPERAQGQGARAISSRDGHDRCAQFIPFLPGDRKELEPKGHPQRSSMLTGTPFSPSRASAILTRVQVVEAIEHRLIGLRRHHVGHNAIVVQNRNWHSFRGIDDQRRTLPQIGNRGAKVASTRCMEIPVFMYEKIYGFLRKNSMVITVLPALISGLTLLVCSYYVPFHRRASGNGRCWQRA